MSTVSRMLDRMDGLTNVVSTDKYGFNVNGIYMRGSVIAFSNFTLLWNCLRVADASPRNLAVVHAVRPKPEMLIIGTGDTTVNINPSLYAYFSRKGVSVEPMATVHAISTFNVLIQEGRNAAAALVCRTSVSREDACLYTPEAAALSGAKHERELAEALGGRATQLALEGLAGGRQQRLIEGGAAASVQPPPSGAAGAGEAAAAQHPAPLILPKLVDASRRAVDVTSLTVGVKYGYPGALPPDVSPVRPGGVGPAMPRTTEEMLDAMARKGTRRSGVKPPPGTFTDKK